MNPRNIERVRRVLAAISVGNKTVADAVEQSRWDHIVAKIGPALPLRGRPLDVRNVDWYTRALLQLAFLVPDVRWLPFAWSARGNSQYSGGAEQSARLILDVVDPGAPLWWPEYNARIAAACNGALQAHPFSVADLYLRDGYECYNGVSALLCTHTRVPESVRQLVLDRYFLDPRFPEVALHDLFYTAVPDKVVIDATDQLYRNVITMMPFSAPSSDRAHLKGSLSMAPWMQQEDRLRRFAGMMHELLTTPALSGEAPPVRPRWVAALLANDAQRKLLHLSLADLCDVLDRYTGAESEACMHRLVRHVVQEDRFDWAASLYSQPAASAEWLSSIVNRFLDDPEIVGIVRELLETALRNVGMASCAASTASRQPLVL